MTSGMSVFETVDPLREVGLKVTDVVVLLDREQGGKTNVENGDLKLHSVLNVTEILNVLVQAQKITIGKAEQVHQFVKNNQVKINPKKAEVKKLYHYYVSKLIRNDHFQKFAIKISYLHLVPFCEIRI